MPQTDRAADEALLRFIWGNPAEISISLTNTLKVLVVLVKLLQTIIIYSTGGRMEIRGK